MFRRWQKRQCWSVVLPSASLPHLSYAPLSENIDTECSFAMVVAISGQIGLAISHRAFALPPVAPLSMLHNLR